MIEDRDACVVFVADSPARQFPEFLRRLAATFREHGIPDWGDPGDAPVLVP